MFTVIGGLLHLGQLLLGLNINLPWIRTPTGGVEGGHWLDPPEKEEGAGGLILKSDAFTVPRLHTQSIHSYLQ